MLLKQFNTFMPFLLLILFFNYIVEYLPVIKKTQQEITPEELIKKIDNNIVNGARISFELEYSDFIIDIRKKTLSSGLMKKTEKVKFEYDIQRGSFLNKNANEILFIISFKSGLTGRALNDGLSLKYIFDENLNQISEPIIFGYGFNVQEVRDIDDNGISEIYFTSEQSTQGYTFDLLRVYEKNLEKPILIIDIGYSQHGAYGYAPGTSDTFLQSTYTFNGNAIEFSSTVNIYKKGIFKKSKECFDVYKLKDGRFTHQNDSRNVNWNDVDCSLPQY